VLSRSPCRLLCLSCLFAGLGALLLGPPPGRGFAPAPITRARFTNSLGMKFVRIPAGKFLMGSPASDAFRYANELQHEVQITKAFYLGVHEVTQAQYEKIIGKNPAHFSATGLGRGHVEGMDTRNFPIETVTWNEAEEFCKRLTRLSAERAARRVYRLPSEAEWEYACRAGAKEYTPYNVGTTISIAQANHASRLNRTTPVGSYKPNAWGLYDMHGNVWEWCQDWYDDNYYRTSPRKDPTGPAARPRLSKVARGGAYFNHAQVLRSARRASSGSRGEGIGFRVACNAGSR
jgi:formylglycine-generating enzyme required for sulfatase activity